MVLDSTLKTSRNQVQNRTRAGLTAIRSRKHTKASFVLGPSSFVLGLRLSLSRLSFPVSCLPFSPSPRPLSPCPRLPSPRLPGTWDLGLGTWDLRLGTWDLGLETWDLGLGTLQAPVLKHSYKYKPLATSDNYEILPDLRSALRRRYLAVLHEGWDTLA